MVSAAVGKKTTPTRFELAPPKRMDFKSIALTTPQRGQIFDSMRQPRIELGSTRWQRAILAIGPLAHVFDEEKIDDIQLQDNWS